MYSTQNRFLDVIVSNVWLPLLVMCLYLLIECQSSSSIGESAYSNSQLLHRHKRATNSDLEDPPVIVGILVGVVGVLVVLGVSILLCRLFCCKRSACCGCLSGGEEEERYLDAGTVPIKIPTQETSPDPSPPISTITHSRPTPTTRHSHSASSHVVDSSSNLPQYDDIPQPEWKVHNLPQNETVRESEFDKGSQDLAQSKRSEKSFSAANDREVPDGLSSSRKRRENTPTRRKLTYGAQDAESSQNESQFINLERERPKKRNLDGPRHRKEGHPPLGHGKRNNFPPTHEDPVGVSVMERNPPQMSQEREFPLLEYEPQKRSFDPDASHRAWEETGYRNRDFRSVEYDSEPRPLQQHSYPDPRRRLWEEERRPREYREDRSAHGPPSVDSRQTSGTLAVTAGRVNPAFNQESTETTV